MIDLCLTCGAYWKHDHESGEDFIPPPPLDTTPKGMLPTRWDARLTPIPEYGNVYIQPDGLRPKRVG